MIWPGLSGGDPARIHMAGGSGRVWHWFLKQADGAARQARTAFYYSYSGFPLSAATAGDSEWLAPFLHILKERDLGVFRGWKWQRVHTKFYDCPPLSQVSFTNWIPHPVDF